VEMGDVFNPNRSSFTASAWVKRATTGLQTIFAKSNGGPPNPTYGWTMSFGAADQLQGFIANGGKAWGETGAFDFRAKTDAAVVDSAQWHYAVIVTDRNMGNNCKTYIDGVDVTDSLNGAMENVGVLVNALPLRIGAEADDDYPWTGSIDECVISRVARSAAWIGLCYANQGPHDRLVKFK
jgi:hypothetical protein